MPRIHSKRSSKSPYQCMHEEIAERRAVEDMKMLTKSIEATMRIGLVMIVGGSDDDPEYFLTEFGGNLRGQLSSEAEFTRYFNYVYAMVEAGADPADTWSTVITGLSRDEIHRDMQKPHSTMNADPANSP